MCKSMSWIRQNIKNLQLDLVKPMLVDRHLCLGFGTNWSKMELEIWLDSGKNPYLHWIIWQTCYLATEPYTDLVRDKPRISNFAIAVVATKFTEPLRIGLTLGIAPKFQRREELRLKKIRMRMMIIKILRVASMQLVLINQRVLINLAKKKKKQINLKLPNLKTTHKTKSLCQTVKQFVMRFKKLDIVE